MGKARCVGRSSASYWSYTTMYYLLDDKNVFAVSDGPRYNNIIDLDWEEPAMMLNTAALFQEVRKDADAAGIPYDPDTRYYGLDRCTRSLGRCHRRQTADGHMRFTITISRYISTLRLQAIKDVMMHELIHTIPGCFNHSAQFKLFADMVNRRTNGTYAVKTSYKGSKFQQNTPYKYIVECKNCKRKIYRTRKSKLILHPELYRCTCGGHFSVYAAAES